jgi:hypothetical protein
MIDGLGNTENDTSLLPAVNGRAKKIWDGVIWRGASSAQKRKVPARAGALFG